VHYDGLRNSFKGVVWTTMAFDSPSVVFKFEELCAHGKISCRYMLL
jgi:hypothetical protein